MQVCEECENYNKCKLKDESLFELCPRLDTIQNITDEISTSKEQQIVENTPIEIEYEVLQRYFGFSEFRHPQKEIITDILNHKDVLVLMPTGGEKSLCYQYPSLLFDGITIVISPLISLMKNQVDALRSNGINAAYINSSLNLNEIKKIKSDLENTRIKLLYIAPERLTMPSFLTFLQELEIILFAIDEAHCISEWGHDFRTEYRQLKLIREKFPKVPIIALTATATLKVQKDIKNQLNLRGCKRYLESFNRKNLIYNVRPKKESFQQILQILKNRPGESGIIYCQSKKTVDSLTKKLQNAGHRALPYHAGLSQQERAVNQEKFFKEDADIIIATIAFGMGIDKSNIRFIIHYDLPKNLESYYQETGRAGRDGLKSDCILFYTYADKQKIEYFINQMNDEREAQIAQHKLRDIVHFCESRICRRKILLGYFGEDLEENNCQSCDNCLHPKEKIDATQDVLTIISCIKELDERFGINYVIDVLIGSNNRRLLQNGHTNLKSFQSGKNQSKKIWQSYIRELLHLGYLKQEGDVYPLLRLNSKSIDLLSDNGNNGNIFLTKPEVHKDSIKTTQNTEYDTGLFETLRTLRKKLADAENYPPYIIFSDASLKQMAAICPDDFTAFRTITGVGDMKLEKYGQIFIEEIKKYCNKN
ncbi:MAG: DNA helicase RecQ [Candidatus Methanoperedens sp.]|nr:DNA helicase RecQ [Candidatus Methanoperedens sp.]